MSVRALTTALHREMIISLLRHYALDIGRIVAVPYCDYHIFRLFARDGQSYRVRVRDHEDGAHQEMRSHMTWLSSLRRSTCLNVPTPVPMRNGKYIQLMKLPEPSQVFHCAIVTWMPGTILGRRRTKPNCAKFGAATAHLHEYGGRFTAPRGFVVPTELGCCRGDSKLFATDMQPLLRRLKRQQSNIFEAATEKVAVALSNQITPTDKRHVIHGDLHEWNASIHEGQVQVFDFECIKWGLPIQDIALWRFRETCQDWLQGNSSDLHDAETGRLVGAFIEGYSSVRPWPEEDTSQWRALVARHVLIHARDHGQPKRVLAGAALLLKELLEM